MVNEEKVKIMNRLAMYEHGEGRKYLPVSRYYRSDYIGTCRRCRIFQRISYG